MPSPPSAIPLRALSRLLGWIYTLAWSLSFYPQPLLLLSRRSTLGSTPAYPFLNTLGFASYTISTALFLYSPLIRAQYATRHSSFKPSPPVTQNAGYGALSYSPHPLAPQSQAEHALLQRVVNEPAAVAEPAVQVNDLVFAVHAVLLSIITASMYLDYKMRIPFIGNVRLGWGFVQAGGKRRVGRGTWGIAAGVCVGVGLVAVKVLVDGDKGWEWIDVVSALGTAKLTITFLKYLPQVYLNFQRKSTIGWSIVPWLLDATGSVTSILQLLIDSYLQGGTQNASRSRGGNWEGVKGNPVKLGLGLISLGFDAIYMCQHYILYKGAGERKRDGDAEGRGELLGADGTSKDDEEM